ncbi:MAG: hypothetical protein ACKVQV_15380, partial [Bacteroidia bacterium]
MRQNAILRKTIGFILITFYSFNLNAQVFQDTIYIPTLGIPGNQFIFKTDFCSGANGSIYIGFRSAGILERNLGVWQRITNSSTGGQLPSDSIYKFHTPTLSDIWIGHAEGVSHKTSSGFVNYLFNSSNGFPKKQITALSTDLQTIYVGTNSGLYVYNTNTGIAINYNSQNTLLQSDSIKCLFKDLSGGLWIGTNLGYSILKNGVISPSPLNGTSLINTNIIDIVVTPADTILLSKNYGMIRRNNNKHYLIDSTYFWRTKASFCGTNIYSNLQIVYKPNGKLSVDLALDHLNNIYCLEEIDFRSLLTCISPNHSISMINLSPAFNFLYNINPIKIFPLHPDSIIIYNGKYTGNSLYKIGSKNSTNYYPAILPFSPIISQDSSTFPVSISPSYTATEANAILDGNMIKTRLLNRGDMHWDPVGQSPLYEVPQSTGLNSVYASSIWLGGFDQSNQLVTAAQTYRQQSSNDFWPGPLDINGQSTPTINQMFDSIWIARRSDIDEFRFQYSLGNVQNGNYIIPNIILNWPVKFSNPNYPQKLAPYVDVNGDNFYNPYDGDYPAVKGDQMAWWVFNDYGMKTETNSIPFPVEIHAYAYSINCSNNSNIGTGLSYTTFYHYDVFNRSFGTYDSLYFGMWCDSDLGNAVDDATGCNLLSNSYYFYNGDSIDE